MGFFFLVLILRSVVRYAYESLGVGSNTAIFWLFARSGMPSGNAAGEIAVLIPGFSTLIKALVIVAVGLWQQCNKELKFYIVGQVEPI